MRVYNEGTTTGKKYEVEREAAGEIKKVFYHDKPLHGGITV